MLTQYHRILKLVLLPLLWYKIFYVVFIILKLNFSLNVFKTKCKLECKVKILILIHIFSPMLLFLMYPSRYDLCIYEQLKWHNLFFCFHKNSGIHDTLHETCFFHSKNRYRQWLYIMNFIILYSCILFHYLSVQTFM